MTKLERLKKELDEAERKEKEAYIIYSIFDSPTSNVELNRVEVSYTKAYAAYHNELGKQITND